MLVQAKVADTPRIESFLSKHPDTSMFLRSNLAAHGPEGGNVPHATRYFLWQPKGKIRAVFGMTNTGFLMCQAPDAPGEAYASFAKKLTGRHFVGMTGVDAQVSEMLRHLNLPSDHFAINRTEPLCILDAGNIPECEPGELRHANEQDKPLLRDWFIRYNLETGLAADEQSATRLAEARLGQPLLSDMFLIENGAPVALMSLNAVLPDMVSVGNVYVPEALRGQGRAGQMVVSWRRSPAGQSIRRVVLFAASDMALRAYQKVGFRPVETFRVAMMKAPTVVGGAK